jgi:hypothetical protein
MSITVVPNSVAVVDAKTNRLVGDVVGRRPVSVAAGRARSSSRTQMTARSRTPKTRKVAKVRGIGTDIHQIAVGFGSPGSPTKRRLTRIDPSLNDPGVTLRFGADQRNRSSGRHGADRSMTRGNTLLRINPAIDQVEARSRSRRRRAGGGIASDLGRDGRPVPPVSPEER